MKVSGSTGRRTNEREYRYIHKGSGANAGTSISNAGGHAAMKKSISILLLLFIPFVALADHITGGQMYYTYNGLSNGQNNYTVTLKLYMRCNSGRQFPDPAVISVFNKQSFERFSDVNVTLTNRETISITNSDPCIYDPPTVCYEVAYYTFTISLPVNASGYILSSEVNYRIRGINNINSEQVGATYTCEIPGSVPLPNGFANVSAKFTGSDLVVVCAKNYFEYSFGAHDDDGDQLRYYFCAAYASTSSGIGGIPAGNPPYPSVFYNAPGYTATFPLGDKVKIDPNTGLISGIAPEVGIYVVTVCVEEVRNGALIATQRKDLQINITDCSVAAAQLNEEYMLCGDTRSIEIRNQSNSPLIVTQDWEMFNQAGVKIYSGPGNTLNYTFPANGTYTVQLTVNKGRTCTDTTEAKVFVYPGLKPDFAFSGICITKPILFTDKTTLVSGSVNSWTWDFGQQGYNNDVSSLQVASYLYPNAGPKPVQLIVTTTDGCRDTISKTVNAIDRPIIDLRFADTLICVNDKVQLFASGTGNFQWTPAINIINANTQSPVVNPVLSAWYYVELNNDGCISKDSIHIRVTDRVNLAVMNDTTICSGDPVLLQIVSDGFQYVWTPASSLSNAFIKTPVAVTSESTDYRVTAYIGGCVASKVIHVNTVPYPAAHAGNDTTICYNTPAFLRATTDGNSWSWQASTSLNSLSSLNPVASPVTNTAYVFSAYDSRGCPKPGMDTVSVIVLPKIVPYAGNDTSVIVGQPLQMQATGGENYAWFPSQYLSDYSIANPVATFSSPAGDFIYKVEVSNSAGCIDSAFIHVKAFATEPVVFVPTAFTPNNDGKNDVLRPIAVGMRRIDFFQVYNRWGQLLYSTRIGGQGWDGRVNGELQANNVYVWVVKALDYKGTSYLRKGTFTLIR
jgi:gliding motility-associated-like protein